MAVCRFTAELKAADAAAAAQASKADQALEQLRQELTGKLQAETVLLRQQASMSLTSAASQHDQALTAQRAQHAQAVQTLQAEAGSLASSRQSLEEEISQLRAETQQLQGQVQALQGSMLQQAQHAQQAAAELDSKRESERLSMQAAHAAELVVLRGQQAASAQEAEEAMQAQQQQAEHLHATLLARFSALEKRFNARYVECQRTIGIPAMLLDVQHGRTDGYSAMLLIILLLTSLTLALQLCISELTTRYVCKSAQKWLLAMSPAALSPCRPTVDLETDNLQVTVVSQMPPMGEETSLQSGLCI